MKKAESPGLPQWLAALTSARDLAACVESFKAIIAPYGVVGFASGELDLEKRDRSTFHAVEWPDAWLKFYLAGMIARDPLFPAIESRKAPFTWSELLADGTLGASDRQALKLSAEAGWEEGLVVPMPRGGRRYGLVSLLRARGAFSEREKAELAFVSVYFHELARGLSPATSFAAAPNRLGPRAAESLAMAARGHSDREIGAALGISPHTAHEYVETAKRRLGAKSRVHAVALAVSLGVINP
jgi:DNA-binding CsgD family transcriptional regulator